MRSGTRPARTLLAILALAALGSSVAGFVTTHNVPTTAVALHPPTVARVLSVPPSATLPFVSVDARSKQSRKPTRTSVVAKAKPESGDTPIDQDAAQLRSALTLVTMQATLIVAAVAFAAILGTPNFGLGPTVQFSRSAVVDGIFWTLPLGVSAVVLEFVEPYVRALRLVTVATQRTTLVLLGTEWKPKFALATALGLGLAAGIGEEMLFRGVMQYELASRLVTEPAAVGITSIVFALLHAITPMYAILAGVASVYFGWLYSSTGNLVVPIVAHAIYDVVALMFAHYTVTKLPPDEQQLIAGGQENANDNSGSAKNRR